jgi:serine protease Do
MLIKTKINVATCLLFIGQTALAANAPSEANLSVFEQVAEKIIPSVVNISSVTTVKSPLMESDPLFRHFFEQFFGNDGFSQGMPPGSKEAPGEGPGEGPRAQGPKGGQAVGKAIALGSGFIIDEKGTILTNNHVVADATEIKVTLTEKQDEAAVDAKVVGRDPALDIALIRLKQPTKNMPAPVHFGDSDKVRIGQPVLAVGNPFGQGHSATHGIISQKERQAPGIPLATYLQTDAPINPGNSGGPLVAMDGTVIGINNAIVAQAHGIGFAIPINVVRTVLPELQTKGTVTRGYIGVAVENISPDIAQKIGVSKDVHAPFVVQVSKDSPAQKSGLQPYDVITKFSEKEIHSGTDLMGAVSSAPVGKTSTLVVIRDGKEKKLEVTPTARPTPKEMAQTPVPEPHIEGTEVPRAGMAVSNITRDIASEIGVPGSTKGVAITSMIPGGPADSAGLEAGDIILEVDRKPVQNAKQLTEKLKDSGLYLLRVRRVADTEQDQYFVAQLNLRQ